MFSRLSAIFKPRFSGGKSVGIRFSTSFKPLNAYRSDRRPACSNLSNPRGGGCLFHVAWRMDKNILPSTLSLADS